MRRTNGQLTGHLRLQRCNSLVPTHFVAANALCSRIGNNSGKSCTGRFGSFVWVLAGIVDVRPVRGNSGKSGPAPRNRQLPLVLPEVSEWTDKEATVTPCLAFITKKSNVKISPKHMGSIKQKHMGIFVNNKIWHYSISKNKVVNQTVEDFKKHFGSSQAALAEYGLYYGKFPV